MNLENVEIKKIKENLKKDSVTKFTNKVFIVIFK
jgi:hypothetical protein